MTKRLLTLALAGSLLNLFAAGPVYAETQAEKDARRALKVKAGVRKLGTGEKAHVHVTLKDKTKLKGYVSAVGEDNFTVTDARTGAATVVAYTQVKQIEGHNLSTGAKIAIAFGIVAAAALILFLLALHDLNKF